MSENIGYIHTKEGIKEALRRNRMMGQRKINFTQKEVNTRDPYSEFLESYVFDRLNMTPIQLLHSLEHQYYAEDDFRRRRQRNIDFTRGRHFNEIVYDPELRRSITQWEYLKRRNLPPLTYNLVSKLQRSLVGQFREVNTGNVVKCESKDDRGAEIANYLTQCLNRVKENNKAKAKDAKNMKEMTASGRPVFKVLWGSKNNMTKKDVRFRIVNTSKFGMNPGVTDDDLANLHTCYEIHDTDLNSIVGLFSNGNFQRGREIKENYTKNLGDQRRQASYSAQSYDGTQLTNQTFYSQGIGDASCRYFEIWTKISDFEAATYDPLELPGNNFKVYKWQDPEKVYKEIQAINQERIENSEGEVDPEELQIQFSTEYRSRWYVSYVTPWGYLLDVRESPYKNGMMPYVFPSPDLNGEMWGIIEEVLNAQLGLDRQILQADSVIDNASKGVWLVPSTAVPDEMSNREYLREIKRTDGAVIVQVRDGYDAQDVMPKQMYANATNVSAQLQQMITLYSSMFDEISGNYGAAQGRSDSDAKTATGYALESQNAGLNIRDTFEIYLDLLLQRDELILMFILEGYTKEDYFNITGKEIDPKEIARYEFNIEQSKGTNSPAHRLALEQELLQLVFNQLVPFEVFMEISSNPVMIQAKQKMEELRRNQAQQQAQQNQQQGGVTGEGGQVDNQAAQTAAPQMQSVQGNPQAAMLNQSPVNQQIPKLSRLPQPNTI